jgi:3-oxoacyl-[acyl-carrier protein] reductase
MMESLSISGVIALTRTLAAGLAPNIRVNAIAPGAINTDWFSGRSEEDMQRIRNQCLMKRLGQPTEIAEAAVFLATGATFMTGQTMIIDGGTVFS